MENEEIELISDKINNISNINELNQNDENTLINNVNCNNDNDNINNNFPSFPNLLIDQEIYDDNKHNNNLLDQNNFYTTSFNYNKQKQFLSSDNSRNTHFPYQSAKIRKKNRRIFSTETSIIKKRNKNKKDFMNQITNIDEQLNTIKNEIILTKNDNVEDLYKKFEEIEKKTREDMIVTNILAEKGRVEMQSIQELFKHMKQKSFISDLTKQYFTFTKGRFRSSIKQKFMKELKKVDLIEKKDALLRDLAYKKNYEIRKGINKLKENDLSKERTKFNNKIKKMKQMNINNIENFIKNMNKY